MPFEQLFEKVKNRFKDVNVNEIEGKLAFQFNIIGDEGGVFYLEIKDKKISIEPYDYRDRDALFTITGDNLVKLIEGNLDPIAAYTLGKLKVEGEISKALLISKIISK